MPPRTTPEEPAPAPVQDDVPAAAPVDYEARFALLEEALAVERQRNLEQVQALEERLSLALARPEKLKAPGKFVGRPGAPDSPVEDHYTLVLANGETLDTVHPGATHVHIGDRLVPVTSTYHSMDIAAAQAGTE